MNDFGEAGFMLGLAAKNYDLDGSLLVDKLVIDFIGRNAVQPFTSGLGIFAGPAKFNFGTSNKHVGFSADGLDSRLYISFSTSPSEIEVGILNQNCQFTPEFVKIPLPDYSGPGRFFCGKGFSGDQVKVPVYLLKAPNYSMIISNPAQKMFFYSKTKPKIASYTFWNYFFSETGLPIENALGEDPASCDFSSQVEMYNCNLSLGYADGAYLVRSDFNRALSREEVEVIMHGFSGEFSIRNVDRKTSLRAAFFYTDLQQIPSYLSVLKAYAKKPDSKSRTKVDK